MTAVFRICPACGRPAPSGTPGETPHLVRCAGCGLLLVVPPPDAQMCGRMRAARQRVLDSELTVPAVPSGHGEIDWLLTMLPAGGERRMLDIGAADGSFAAAWRQRGWTACAIEPLRYPGAAAGIDWRHGTAEEELPSLRERQAGTFMLVSLRESLYYCTDWRAVLRAAHELLVPGGLVYLKNHVATSAYYRFFGNDRLRRIKADAQGFPERRVLRELLLACGFSLVAERPFPYEASWYSAPQAPRRARLINRVAVVLHHFGLADRYQQVGRKAA